MATMTDMLHFRIDKQVRSALKRLAKRDVMTLAGYIRKVLIQHIRAEEKAA